MLRRHGHRRLLPGRQLEEGLGRQIVQSVACVKHLPVVAVNLLRRVDPLIAEVVCHLCSHVIDPGNVEYHDAVPHLLSYVAIRMGLPAGPFSPAGAAVKISAVLVVGRLVAEGKEDIVACP